MSLLQQRRPGRQLMVLDDAETIARQARRRAAARRRRREALKGLGVITGLLAVVAILLGAAIPTVLVSWAAVMGVLLLAFAQLRERRQMDRQRKRRANPGQGIGTPRPKGAFSTTRHRSGAPVWVSDQAA
ncbi:hypothetical protein [Euzebya tangerina]|uniref:hypothetical protein n=1 Tax=Euzebya tangerina TaxID=591198 RepID=UPI000E316167|nr:hypothetical protein [Euzebya tangerina]